MWYRRCLGQNKQSVLVGVGAKNMHTYVYTHKYISESIDTNVEEEEEEEDDDIALFFFYIDIDSK